MPVFRDVRISRNEGWVAQLVEQRIENPRVGGSIPPPATTNIKAHSDVGFFVLYAMGHWRDISNKKTTKQRYYLATIPPPACCIISNSQPS